MESIYNSFQNLIGEGDKILALWQILLRALMVFILTIIIIRISDRRAYSLLSPFENVIVFLHGALLGRIILDPTTPFMPAIAAAVLISILHRAVAMLSIRYELFGSLIKDKPVELYKNDVIIEKNMIRMNISKDDLFESARKSLNTDSLETVKTARLERNGNISFVLKEEEQ